MANNLTGDYEAVLQVSVRKINGLLATLHQHGGEPPDQAPSFPHRSLNLTVGCVPKILDPGISQFGQWLGSAAQSVRAFGGPESTFASPLEIGAHLAEKAPPGAAVRFEKDLSDLIAAQNEVPPTGKVCGLADVQISTPAISLVGSEVVVHVYVRAHYYPESGTAPLPEPIHGEVRIRYQLVPKTVNGQTSLEVQVPSDDSRIQFFPNPGSVSQADADNEIVGHIRKAVRERFKATPVDVGDFKLFEFKALGSPGDLHDQDWRDALGTGANQALALPMQLSGAAAPPGALDSVTNPFLGTGPAQSDFGIAVCKEFVESFIDLQKIKDAMASRSIQRMGATYHLRFTAGPTLTWKSGAMDIYGHIRVETQAALRPDGYVDFTQTIGLELDVATQSFTLKPLGEPVVDESWFIPHDDAVNNVKDELNKALLKSTTSINSTFNNAKGMLVKGLHSFDKSLDGSSPPIPAASYTAVEITPDGIIVRGAINTKFHFDPEIRIDDTSDGNSWTALNCWIRGGRIDRFVWHWVEEGQYVATGGRHRFKWITNILGGTNKSFTEDHRFTHGIPMELKGRPLNDKGVCLTIEGIQVTADGKAVDVTGKVASGTCRVTWSEPILVVNPIKEAIFVALHEPEPPVDGVIAETVTGHVNIQSGPGGVTSNSLIHFAGALAERPLQTIDQALAQIRRSDFALTSVIVMARGTFASTSRRQLEEQLGMVEELSAGRALATEARDSTSERARESGEGFTRPLIITEDYVDGWTRTFGVAETPVTYIVNARGEFVWKQEGQLDPERLTAALDEYLLPSQRRPALALRLTVGPGERAPDAKFEDDRGQVLALHRLRGKSVLLVFWQSWSGPCIKELLWLQQLQEAGGERAPVIVAVNGGEAREIVAEVRRQYKLTLTLVPDPDQRIGQLYGVACWPTTVSINPDGMVDRIQFGVTRIHGGLNRG